MHSCHGALFEPTAKTGFKVPPTKLDALLKEECNHTTCQAEPTPSISSNTLTCKKPTDRTTSTYLRIVAALKPNKEEPIHIRFTVCGNRIDYKGNVSNCSSRHPTHSSSKQHLQPSYQSTTVLSLPPSAHHSMMNLLTPIDCCVLSSSSPPPTITLQQAPYPAHAYWIVNAVIDAGAIRTLQTNNSLSIC